MPDVGSAVAPAWLDRLTTWLPPFEECFGHVAQRGAFKRYLLGLLSDSRRKSMSAMLARISAPGSYEAFQHFISDAPWVAEPVWRRLRATTPDRESMLILDRRVRFGGRQPRARLRVSNAGLREQLGDCLHRFRDRLGRRAVPPKLERMLASEACSGPVHWLRRARRRTLRRSRWSTSFRQTSAAAAPSRERPGRRRASDSAAARVRLRRRAAPAPAPTAGRRAHRLRASSSRAASDGQIPTAFDELSDPMVIALLGRDVVLMRMISAGCSRPPTP